MTSDSTIIFETKYGERFTTKEKDILERNRKFFSAKEDYKQMMLEIISGKSEISIRILDFFVANYSRKNNTSYKIKINGVQEYFYVNSEYKNQLNCYSKKYFDPFCRKKSKKIYYRFLNAEGKKKKFLTSIGQLNFFQWAISNKIVVYVKKHIQEIDLEMKQTAKINRERRIEFQNSLSENQTTFVAFDDSDSELCSSENINCIRIASSKSSSNKKTDSDKKFKRYQMAKSIISINNRAKDKPIILNFD